MIELKISVRRAVDADVSSIELCVRSAYEHYISRMNKPPGPMLDDYASVIQQHQVFVMEANKNIIGALVLINDDGRILLDNVAISPDYQGQGLGKRLIEHAELQARSQGFTHLDLYTHECMTENIAIYKNYGYVETERKTEKGYERIYFRKQLKPIS